MKTRYFIDYEDNKVLTEREVRKLNLERLGNEILISPGFYLENSCKDYFEQLITDIKGCADDSIDIIVNCLGEQFGIKLEEIKKENIDTKINSLYKSITKCKDIGLVQEQLDIIYQLKKIELEGDI